MEGGFDVSTVPVQIASGRRSRPGLLAASLLLLALAAALYVGLAAHGRTGAPVARLRPSLRLAPDASGHGRASRSSQVKGLSSLPALARGPISGALGAEDPAYKLHASAGGFAANSPAQHLRLRFEPSGVSLTSGAARVGLSLRAAGYGSSLKAIGEVAPSAKNNRVTYERAGLSEWYVNGPIGLEQGFTIPRALSGAASGPLTLSMALSGAVHVSPGSGGDSVILHAADGSVLHYGGVTATDASGRALHSWLVAQHGRVLLRVDTRGARYPLRIDPWIAQGEKLTGGGERGEEGKFGFSVALSPEGTTALIGGPADNEGAGAAWVFTRTSGVWTQQGEKLTGGGEGGAGAFGTSVALSAEGNTAVIGAPADNEGTGAAWVFTRTSGVWTQQGPKITAKSGEETENGRIRRKRGARRRQRRQHHPDRRPRQRRRHRRRVGLHPRERRLDPAGRQTGGQSGEETEKEGEFGASVALSTETTTSTTYALIGAPANSKATGAAWVFTRAEKATTWAQQGAKLTAKSGEETGAGFFGASVALSSEGTTALMGAPGDTTDTGAVWAFTRSGTTWTQQGASSRPTARVGAKAVRRRAWRCPPTATTACADRRPRRRRGRGRGVGVHALGDDLDSAGRKAHRQKRRRDRRRPLRRRRGAVVRRQHRAIGGFGDSNQRRRGVGVHALGHDLDPAGAKARRAAAKESATGEFGYSVALSPRRATPR